MPGQRIRARLFDFSWSSARLLAMSDVRELTGPSTKSRRYLRSLALWILVVLIFYLIFRRVPVQEILDAFKLMNLWRFVPVIVVFVVCQIAFDAYTHYWVFKRFGINMTYREVLEARGASTLLASVGFFYGQGGMAYLVSKKTGKPISVVIGSLIFLFFNSYHTIIIMPTFGLLFFLDYFRQEMAGTMELTGLIVLLCISWPLFFLSIAFWSREWNFWPRNRFKGGGIYHAFHNARFRDYAMVIFLRMIMALFWMLMVTAAMPALGLSLPLGILFAFLPLIQLAGVIPTPGRLGTSEAVWLIVFHNMAPEPLLVAMSLAWMQSVNVLRSLIGLFFARHFTNK